MDKNLPNQLEPIAIVGIGCRFPGGAASPDEFWNLLLIEEPGTSISLWNRLITAFCVLLN